MPWYLLNWFMESVLELCWLNFIMIDSYEQIRNILWHPIPGDCFKTAKCIMLIKRGWKNVSAWKSYCVWRKLGTKAINPGFIWLHESPLNHPPSLSYQILPILSQNSSKCCFDTLKCVESDHFNASHIFVLLQVIAQRFISQPSSCIISHVITFQLQKGINKACW